MFGTGARLAARLDLGAIREVAPQPRDVFVIYLAHVIYAERADLAARAEITSAAAEAWSAGTPVGSTSAIAASVSGSIASAIAESVAGSIAESVAGSIAESVAGSIASAIAGAAAHGRRWAASLSSGLHARAPLRSGSPAHLT
jgi:hypothetical protein